MKKRIVGALLALAMTIGVLAGCGGPSKLNKEEDFDVYKDGQLVQELGNEYHRCSITPDHVSLFSGSVDDLNIVREDSLIGAETRRGIKLGSTLEDVCEVYSGDEIVLMEIFFEDRNKDTIYERGKFRDLLVKYETELKEEDGYWISFEYYEKDGKRIGREEYISYKKNMEDDREANAQDYAEYTIRFCIVEGKVYHISISKN